MRLSKHLNSAIAVLGSLSFVSILLYFAALHDIWHEYASPEVWARAGKELPSWYSQVNRCPLEWGFLQVGFLLMLIFHVMLLVRHLLRRLENISA